MLDSQRDSYPFTLGGEIILKDGEPFQVSRLYKDSEQLTKSIERMIEKYDDSLEVVFSGYLTKYTTVFNQIKRSKYGKGCDAFNKNLEDVGQLCYIPTGNACFRKCLEFFQRRDFPNEYKEDILSSDRCKNIMASAKIQPFCRKYNINLGVYKKKQRSILPKTVTERKFCLLIHNNLFCVIWKDNQSSFSDAIEEMENFHRYEETQINNNNLKQVIENNSPIS